MIDILKTFSKAVFLVDIQYFLQNRREVLLLESELK